MPALRLATRLTPVIVGIAALTVACGSSKSATRTTTPAATTPAVTAPAATTAAAPTTAAAVTSMPGMPSTGATAAGSSSAPATVAAAGLTITIKDFQFGDPTGPVKAGDTVTVINMDSVAHTYADVNGSFDTHAISPNGGKATFKAPKAGTYQVKCDFHASMHGTLTVT